MKGDEVEGWGRKAERDGTRLRWRRGVRVRVLERRTGRAMGGGEQADGGRDSLSVRLQELHFPSHYAPYHCDRPGNPLYPLKLIYIEILNDTHRPEQ